MRCPQCGFISFDHVETCKKCQSYLGAAIAEVNGTTYEVTSPRFLTIAARAEAVSPALSADEAKWAKEKKAAASEREQFPETERYEIEFEGFANASAGEEGAIAARADRECISGAEDSAAAAQSDLPAMDFGDLDISDLAPPTSQSVPGGHQAGLADLDVADLDIDAPTWPVSGSAADKRFLPAVKTGTALDQFDVDLEALFADNKN